jgi:hypothetical protein
VWARETDPESNEKLAEVRRNLVMYGVCFFLLFGGVLFVFWWSRTAVDFSAGQVSASNSPTYRVRGVVRNARSGQPIAWANIEDDPDGSPPLFRADAGADGAYALLTVPLVHHMVISAQGYRPRTVEVGRSWFEWWPRGEQHVDVTLQPE